MGGQPRCQVSLCSRVFSAGMHAGATWLDLPTIPCPRYLVHPYNLWTYTDPQQLEPSGLGFSLGSHPEVPLGSLRTCKNSAQVFFYRGAQSFYQILKRSCAKSKQKEMIVHSLQNWGFKVQQMNSKSSFVSPFLTPASTLV